MRSVEATFSSLSVEVTGSEMPHRAPSVRLVILNWNQADATSRAVQHLLDLDWPRDSLDIVVVDNASTDHSVEKLRHRFPEIDVRPLDTNVGFAGNNAALTDLDRCDFVGLVNNDAFATPHYLTPLVDALVADPTLGAVCPKIVLEAEFVGFDIEVNSAGTTGVRLDQVRAQNKPAAVWSDTPRPEAGSGFDEITARCHLAADRETRMADDTGATWFDLDGSATLWVPALGPNGENQVLLSFTGPPNSMITITPRPGPGQPDAGSSPSQLQSWTIDSGGTIEVDVSTDQASVDVIQNIGTEMAAQGFGRDRGYLEADDGSYDDPADVFGWCGAGVLFRPEYLEDVGLFDDRFFLYYEDLDLAWRGRARGWRYRTVPTSVIRHAHASSTVQGSPSFNRYQVRNRLIVVAKNGSPAMLGRTVVRSLGGTARTALQAVRGSEETRADLANRVKAQVQAIRMGASIWQDRKKIDTGRTVDTEAIEDLLTRG